MPLEIVRNDITRMRVDAIVNAANEHLLMGGGVCGAIFAAAGAEALTKACAKIGYCKTGDAVLTRGFALPAKFVILGRPGLARRNGRRDRTPRRLLRQCAFAGSTARD